MKERALKLHEAKALYIINEVTGIGETAAKELLWLSGGVLPLARAPEEKLMQFFGIGPKRAAKLRALTEWSLLLSQVQQAECTSIRSPIDLANLLMMEMALLEREELRLASLNTKGKVIAIETVYKGSLNSAVVRVCEILRVPIIQNAASFILIHNHPSGDPTPSPEDVRVTQMIVEAGALLDIDVLDHLIIGRNRFVSLKERGLGF